MCSMVLPFTQLYHFVLPLHALHTAQQSKDAVFTFEIIIKVSSFVLENF